MKHSLPIIIIIIALSIGQSACKKFVDVDPPATATTGASVFNSEATSVAVLNGIYGTLARGNFLAGVGFNSLSYLPGLSADEFTLWNGSTSNTEMAYYTNSLTAQKYGGEFWGFFYTQIYTCNSLLEGINTNSPIPSSSKKQIIGEALFLRALFYFYLVNLYGDVPLVLGTDYKLNAQLTRSSIEAIYRQIIADLKNAKDLLAKDYLKSDLITKTPDRIRPTFWAATALLAKAYLFTNDYANAEIQATALLENNTAYALQPLSNTFLANNLEAIWQLPSVFSGWNTEDAKVFVLPKDGFVIGPNNSNPVYLSKSLVESFEQNDGRRFEWVDSVIIGPDTFYFPYKYKINTPDQPGTEYLTIFRLSEQYLIRSESRLYQNNVLGALSDLNEVRSRAGLPAINSGDNITIEAAILQEKRVELFSEWGNRWLDLKRTKLIIPVMTVEAIKKGGDWAMSDSLYPIPLSEIRKNSNLTQNAGY